MFEKSKLKKNIKKCLDEISVLESKRSRSQSALVQAILEHEDPNEQDVDFFNQYTEKINETRTKMNEYQKQLDELNK